MKNTSPCQTHPKEDISFYCEEHKKYYCQTCLLETKNLTSCPSCTLTYLYEGEMGYKYQGLFEQCAAKIKLYHSELTSKKKFLDDLIVKAKALESEIIKFLSKPAPSAPEREPLKNASPDKIAAGILAEFNSLVQESYNKLLDRYDQACLELKKMVSI